MEFRTFGHQPVLLPSTYGVEFVAGIVPKLNEPVVKKQSHDPFDLREPHTEGAGRLRTHDRGGAPAQRYLLMREDTGVVINLPMWVSMYNRAAECNSIHQDGDDPGRYQLDSAEVEG
jgi:hypothetical protein